MLLYYNIGGKVGRGYIDTALSTRGDPFQCKNLLHR
jgi:hypothetical protein